MPQNHVLFGDHADAKSVELSQLLFQLLLHEAEAQNPQSQFKLGVCFEYGIGTARSMFDAVKWYRASGENGFPNGKQKLEHFSKYGFCLWSSENGEADWDLIYTKLKEEYNDGSGQTGMQIAPTNYI